MSIKLKGMCPLLEVFDMARSLALYRDVLGFELVESDGYSLYLQWPAA